MTLPSNPRVVAVRPGPGYSVKDVHDGWVEGLRDVGCWVADWNIDERAEVLSRSQLMLDDGSTRKAFADDDAVRIAVKSIWEALYEVWPHIVLITSGFWIPPAMMDLMRTRGHRVVLLCTESPYEDDKQIPLAAHADVVLVNDPTNLGRFRQVNPHTFYQPHGWRKSLHTPGPAVGRWAADVTFIGTGYPSRIALLEQTDWSGIDLALAGNWDLSDTSPLARFVRGGCTDNRETVDSYRSARAGMNLYRREATDTADGWAAGPREVEMAAVGLPFARESRPESDRLFPGLPTFHGPQELATAVRQLLDRPPDPGRLRAAVADRSFTDHAGALLRRLDNLEQGA